ncbi:MAG: RNA chaperone Hfq [Tissierellia bacterium]|nr:RNA chaperone Hfq [Tissierellia bacterium]
MKTNINLQDVFLNKVRKENKEVFIYLINGYQIKGMIKGFDNYVIIVENGEKQQLVYKHAISTITPSKPINFINKNNEE